MGKEQHSASPVDANVMRCLADMAQATAWLNFTTAQANHDIHRYGEWQCDYVTQATTLQNDYETACRDLKAAAWLDDAQLDVD